MVKRKKGNQFEWNHLGNIKWRSTVTIECMMCFWLIFLWSQSKNSSNLCRRTWLPSVGVQLWNIGSLEVVGCCGSSFISNSSNTLHLSRNSNIVSNEWRMNWIIVSVLFLVPGYSSVSQSLKYFTKRNFLLQKKQQILRTIQQHQSKQHKGETERETCDNGVRLEQLQCSENYW